MSSIPWEDISLFASSPFVEEAMGVGCGGEAGAALL